MTIKQILFQTYLSVRPCLTLGAALCAFGIANTLTIAQAQTMSSGSGKEMTTLRLVAESGLKDGRYAAGVDITMVPGAHTYWKNPGEAGVPPVFVFNGSENVAKADVKFPAPTRISEDGLDAFGYVGQVVFPVVVTPVDPNKPAKLHVDVTYAVCSHICVPGHGDADLQLRPRGDGRSPELVTAAMTRVPRSLADADALQVSRDAAAAQPTWTLTWAGKPALDDIFADAPEGYYFSTKKVSPGSWKLTAAQSVVAPRDTHVPVALVLAGPAVVAETMRTFDLSQNDSSK